MSYHPRIETAEMSSFLTTRSRNSELWFVNNTKLEEAILGLVAKISNRYNVSLYAFAIEGNHIQGPAEFPNCNRAPFMRDLNSAIAVSIPRYVKKYPGGRFWGRRYSSEFLPDSEDIEDRFFYTVLQPVQDGLVERISEYPGYNCFHDAVWGKSKKYKVIRWAQYNTVKRYDPSASISNFTDVYELKFKRLPGYEELSQKEYDELMHKKLEERRIKIVNERIKKGLGFLGREALLQIKPGSTPKNTKTSTITSFRPRVLSVCPKRRKMTTDWYFSIQVEYKEASLKYRNGDLEVEFPPGTYYPPPITVTTNAYPL